MLTDQRRIPHIRIRRPPTDEQLAQERVQRFFLTAELLAATAVLLPEGTQEPFQDQQGALLGIGFLGRGDEELWVFGPVGRVFGQGGGGEDEGWGGQ